MNAFSLIRSFIVFLALFYSGGRLWAETDDNGPLDGSDVNDEPDVYVKIDAIPHAALGALRHEAAGIQFDLVELDMDTGVAFYALEWENADGVFEVTVGEEGDLVKRDAKLSLSEVSGAVEAAIKTYFPPGSRVNIEYTTTVSYEFRGRGGDDDYFLEIDPAGRILQAQGIDLDEGAWLERGDLDHKLPDQDFSVWRPVDLRELPALVLTKLRENAGEGTVSEVVQRQTYLGTSTYEAEWDMNGLWNGVHISDAGDLLEQRRALDFDELPTRVREIAERYLPDTSSARSTTKLSAAYDLDVDLPDGELRLIVEPSGRVIEASGWPDALSAAPEVRVLDGEILIRHRALLGMSRPQLEIATELSPGSWRQLPMVPAEGSQLEARVPRQERMFFRIRFE